MVQKMTMWVAAAMFAAGLCGTADADQISELRREMERQYNELRNVQSKLAEIEKQQAETPPGTRPNDLRAFWSDGLRFETQDKAVQLRIGGRIHHDWSWLSGDAGTRNAYSLQDGTQFRRARLYMRGDIHENTHFRVQLDFAGANVAFKDVFVAFKGLPVGTFRLGQFKEPFSLEELTSSNNITFMERALPTVFAPSRNIGAMLSDSMFDRQMTWAAGVFRETADDAVRVQTNDGYNATGRLTYNPVYDKDGARVVHLGAAYTYKNHANDTTRIRQRPEAHLTDRFVDTRAVLNDPSTDIDASNTGIVGLEAAWVEGPFSLQGEYMKAMVSGTAGQQNVDFDGYYVQGSYWLTGESRRYNRGSGSFDFVRPNRPLGKDGGWGAWEIAGRYSHLDLNDGNINGGKLDSYTAGLNWHMNNNTRVMWNYVRADRDRVGKADIFQMRLQVHF